jgi:hypothetical protein
VTASSPDPYALGADLSSMTVHVVEPGTVIRDDATGQEATVDDTHTVQKDRALYMTGATWTALKAQCDSTEDPAS